MMPINKHVALAAALAGALESEQTLREQGALYSPDEWQNSYEVNKERTTNALAAYREFLKGRE